MTMKKIKCHGGLYAALALTAVLAVLKVLRVIDWSLLWIVAPLWIPLSIDVMASVVYVLYHVRKIKKEYGDSTTETISETSC